MRWLLLIALVIPAWAQEAESGFELRGTATAAGFYSNELSSYPRDGHSVAGGFRAVLYPEWKWNEHWSFDGAMQFISRPYYSEQFGTQGYGANADVLQAHLNYSRFWSKGSLTLRAGLLSTAFGSFLLRYDDAVNPLPSMPVLYGYYSGVTALGLAGIEADATAGKWDFRAQFANSSPVNPRDVFDRDQYGNWAGGAGYTIIQGLRVGASAFRGPYLDRQYPYFFHGEANPNTLPGSGMGVDGSWGIGHWNFYGEWQRIQMDYRRIPIFHQQGAYGEARRALGPRWYVAARAGYVRASAFPGYQMYQTAIGYRPNTHQLIKAGYDMEQGPAYHGTRDNIFTLQLVTTFRAFSLAR